MGKKNWDKIRTQSTEENARYRNVYEDQQLDRSHIEPKQTMASRAIIALVAALFVAIVGWMLVAYIEMASGGSAITKAWNDKFYANDNLNTNFKYVTIRQVIPQYDENNMPIYDEETGQQKVSYQHTLYILNENTGVLIDVQNDNVPVYVKPPKHKVDEFGNLMYDENGEPIYEEVSNEPDLDAEGNPLPVPTVYHKFDVKKLGEESPYYLGYGREYGFVYLSDVMHTYIDYDGKYGNYDDIAIDTTQISNEEYLQMYNMKLSHNGYRHVRLHKGIPEDTSQDTFKDRFVDYRPTPFKLLISFILGGLTFGLLYMVMRKNLDAQNIMSDTSDINQYHNDQHIALPEEIQTLYDIFPDVGAHSSVMVSSMISHQMITNKGLKKVQLARRAKENIKDEDGDIVVYKGDILRDENGEPITDTVPIIDNEFSEALFDASKTPVEKYARRYFDTPTIPYNPGNKNLDKLKDYDTVADLINKDWEFPVYEPQRPGGVYIVDTAPVNTMVLAITRAGKGNLARFVWRQANPNMLIA